jgi:ATP-dependent RNA helicase DBP3
LVVAPTRELAMQTYDNAKEFGEPLGIKSYCVYGGVQKFEQKNALRKNVHILIATPGRLLDLINEGACDISNVNFLVLDEADRMLDNGFEQDIRKIISNTRSDRQTVMFSATWPQSIQKLAHEFLKNPIHITIGSAELHANENIKQIVEVIDPKQKEFRLIELLKKYHKSRKNRVLVFALYKKEAVRLENFLQRRGYNVASIHGDKSQDQRIQALNNFKNGSCPLLIATDVAARGLDIPNVEYVLNYTFPLTIEDYIHRIGRTGRAGSNGTSHTLFTQYDKAHAGELSNVLRDANQEVPEALRNFGGTVKKK